MGYGTIPGQGQMCLGLAAPRSRIILPRNRPFPLADKRLQYPFFLKGRTQVSALFKGKPAGAPLQDYVKVYLGHDTGIINQSEKWSSFLFLPPP
jgi:hypothetical protein